MRQANRLLRDGSISPEDDFAYGQGMAPDATWRSLAPAVEFGVGALPGSGEAMSARDAWDASGRGTSALLRGAYGDAAGEYGTMLLALLGAIPGVGILARGTRGGAQWMDRHVPDNINRMLDNNHSALPEELASRSKTLYNPPSKPQRDFSDDYPTTTADQASGTGQAARLGRDMDGVPLTARFVAGRTVRGGGDQGIPSEAYGPIVQTAAGATFHKALPGALRGRSGRLSKRIDPETGEPRWEIEIASDLNPEQAARVQAHELGHLIDEVAGQIPTAGLSRELDQVYSSLLTGQERTRNLTSPRHVGYSKVDAPRELMAEAIRAYMADPNYLKTVAPKTAETIRRAVNGHPRLSKIIQFNSIAGAGIGGALLADELAQDQEIER